MIIIWNIAFNHICIPKEPWKWLLHVYITILYFRRKFQMSYNPLHFFSLYSTHLLVISPYSLRLWPQTHGFLLQFNIYVDSYPNPRYLQSTTFSICYILEHATKEIALILKFTNSKSSLPSQLLIFLAYLYMDIILHFGLSSSLTLSFSLSSSYHFLFSLFRSNYMSQNFNNYLIKPMKFFFSFFSDN